LSRLPEAVPDDLQLARIWRRLEAPQPGPSAAWRWATAAVLSLAVVIGAGRLYMHLASASAEVLATEGDVFTGIAGGSWVPLRGGDSLSPGALVRSDGSGQGLLRVPEIAALALSTGADLSMPSLGRSTFLRLDRGTITVHVAKRPVGSSFVVLAGDYQVRVVGTLFSVTTLREGQIAVSVSEGIVEVAGNGHRWNVGAGERWSSEMPDRISDSDLPESRGALLVRALQEPAAAGFPALFRQLVREEAQIATQGQRQRAAPPIPTPVPPNAAAEAAPAGGATRPPPPPRAEIRTRRTSIPSVSVASTHSSVVPPTVLAPAPTPTAPPTPTPTPPATPTAVPTATPPAAPIPVRDYYAEALNLTRHGEHQEAAKVLERALSQGEGPRDLELYQLALLKERRLGDPQGALDLLADYQRQFPAGALQQEVSLSIIEADLSLGREQEALDQSARLLARYPGSERADELRLLRGDLLRKRGDCTGAIAEYRTVRGGTALDDARYFAASCRRAMGDGVAADAALRDYLSRYPSGRHAASARQMLGE
jgi:TolA-binding protein